MSRNIINHLMARCDRRWVIAALCLMPYRFYGQTLLNKNIPSLVVNGQPLESVLEILSNKGNFYFSYNSSIINKDSLVVLTAYNKTVRQVLDFLFEGRLEYRESGNYIIIRRAPANYSLITNQPVPADRLYAVSGYVFDEESGEKIVNASIYEKRRLVSTLTNEEGYFKLRLKSKSGKAALTVSKEFYQDTTIYIQPKYNQQLTVAIHPVAFSGKMITVSPTDYLLPDSIIIDVDVDSGVDRYVYTKSDSMKVERTAIVNFLVSSKLKIQSLNLKKFFTDRPFQLSLTPGLSTHGKLSPQVVNNISFNVFGGYSGGVNGIELGGLFNIDKKDAQYVQIGGIFNMVGGKVTGLQVGGLQNTVLAGMEGLQIAGVNNMVTGNLTGFQLGGIYNHASGRTTGMQLGGVCNYTNQKLSGVQLAGVANISNQEMTGVQIGGIFNYAKKLKGVQIGLINVSGSSDGYSLGLINIVVRGYHKLSISTNEVLNTNVAFKTGNRKLYSILQAGMNVRTENKIYSFGYGIGTEIALGRRVSVNPEISSQYLYLGSWDHLNLLNKVHLNLNCKLGKFISIFAGPSFAAYYSDQTSAIAGYKYQVFPSNYRSYDLDTRLKGWFGWNVGINFF